MKIGTGMTKNLIFRLFTIPSLINKEKSVELFFEICVIRERKVIFQSSPRKSLDK
jgi:hypothetical protein